LCILACPPEGVRDRLHHGGHHRTRRRDGEAPRNQRRNRPLQWIGGKIDQELGEHVNPDQPDGGSDQHREDLGFEHSLVDCAHNDVTFRFDSGEVGLHQHLVALHDRFDE
jgi:hypothetical protein